MARALHADVDSARAGVLRRRRQTSRHQRRLQHNRYGRTRSSGVQRRASRCSAGARHRTGIVKSGRRARQWHVEPDPCAAMRLRRQRRRVRASPASQALSGFAAVSTDMQWRASPHSTPLSQARGPLPATWLGHRDTSGVMAMLAPRSDDPALRAGSVCNALGAKRELPPYSWNLRTVLWRNAQAGGESRKPAPSCWSRARHPGSLSVSVIVPRLGAARLRARAAELEYWADGPSSSVLGARGVDVLNSGRRR